MGPSILLLDCSSSLDEKLKRQGFDVVSGAIGFCTGYRQLPSQVYEKDIFIYSPRYFARGRDGGYIDVGQIKDYTPEYSLKHLQDHIFRGATFLIFINRIADNLEKLNEAYSWIPFMPRIDFTKDHQIIAYRIREDNNYDYLVPIVLEKELKTPALQKILSPQSSAYAHPPDVIRLFFNRNREVLGVFIKRGKGELIILPEYKSNDEIISIFLNRVIPKLYSLETHINFIDQFLSPEEKKIHTKVQKTEDSIKKANEDLEKVKEELANAIRNKIQIIKNDETAVLVLNYHDLATQQDDVALFYLYKIIEALEKKYRGEREAKKILGSNKEWNLIGKAANASYADIRHAPKPGEKTKEWTEEKIKECFTASKKIINNYLATLFQSNNLS